MLRHSQSDGQHLRSRAAHTLPEILASRCEPAHTNQMAALGSVGIQDSHPGLVVIQAADGPIRFN
jgi:hypothetical protein